MHQSRNNGVPIKEQQEAEYWDEVVRKEQYDADHDGDF